MRMHILVGGDELYETIKTTFCDDAPTARPNPQLPYSSASVSLLTPGLRTGDLITHANRAKFLLICEQQVALIGEVRSMQRVARAYLTAQADPALSLAPVMLAVGQQGALAQESDMGELAADWVFAPLERDDLMRRATVALRRAQPSPPARPQAPIRLHADSFSASYENKMVRLTKSEFLLANLFIGRLGSVISLTELFDFFSSHGKAATQSNVRVGIFELRLKLEKLSGSALGLVSVYRRGYALRQNSCRNAMQ